MMSPAGARTRARELLLQALYQKQIAGHSLGELQSQFREQAPYERVDQVFFEELLADICREESRLLDEISQYADRPVEQLDPVELSILLIGAYELQARIDTPYKVVINECINLAKRFGAEDGHKYINACLDRASQTLREVEVRADAGG